MNLDGVHRAIVAATSKKKAAALFHTTLGELNRHGHVTDDEARVDLATSEPGVVWYQRMEYGPDADIPWTRERRRKPTKGAE